MALFRDNEVAALRKENLILGSLSKCVFETRTAIGSEPFSLLTCLHTTKFILLSNFFSIKDD